MPNQVISRGKIDRLASRLVYRTRRGSGGLSRQFLRILGIDIPPHVRVGKNLTLTHVGAGHVVHMNTTIGDNVVLNPGVVIGRGDLHGEPGRSAEFHIGNDVIIGANAAVMGKGGVPLTIGDGAVIGACAVVTKDVGPREVWAGNPAQLVRTLPGDSR